MEKLIGTLLSILLFTTIGYAVIIESGNGGSAFATDMSVNMCKQQNVSAVLLCTGNVVKVVSSIEGEGFTIYKPDGRIVPCPDVDPSDMGAECTQYAMQPNICMNASVCAAADSTTNQTSKTNQSSTQNQSKPSAGAPDITVNMSLPELEDSPEQGPIGQEAFIFGVIIVGMIAVALINYVYFKSKGTN